MREREREREREHTCVLQSSSMFLSDQGIGHENLQRQGVIAPIDTPVNSRKDSMSRKFLASLSVGIVFPLS